MTTHIIRMLHFGDIYSVNVLYDSLTHENKRYFHPGFLGFKSIGFNWLFGQIAIFFSSYYYVRKILSKTFPLAALLTIVSTNDSGELIGFAFIKRKNNDRSCSNNGELGIVVKEGFQGKHVGYELMDKLLSLARDESFRRIYLSVLADNIKAINLYEKFGFKKMKLIPQGDYWNNNQYDYLEMNIALN